MKRGKSLKRKKEQLTAAEFDRAFDRVEVFKMLDLKSVKISWPIRKDTATKDL